MSIDKNEQQELLEKLNLLLEKQSQFQQEIKNLERQITNLRVTEPKKAFPYVEEQPEITTETIDAPKERQVHKLLKESDNQTGKVKEKKKSAFSNELEKFIGENLINKIGIAVLIIGVGIGVKYVIDNDLISPLVRIILGYVVGIGLAVFAVRTKAKYLNFSAVLFSGSMAIHYFITYAAYSYYQLFPETVAIILMVIITVLTVALALYYNQQVRLRFGQESPLRSRGAEADAEETAGCDSDLALNCLEPDG